MNTAGLVAFNVLLNAVPAFGVALLLVLGAVRAFRPAPGLTQIALLAIPHAKLLIDLVRGVPSGSFLWLRAQGIQQDLGSLQAGVGLWWLVPRIQLVLGALSGGERYSQSAADLFAALLMKRVSAWAPAGIALVLLAAGAARLVLRAIAWARAANGRRRLSGRAALLETHRVGWRTVAIFLSDELAGSPFTGGLFSPYIVFPRRIWERFEPEERRAALAHELAHVAEHHLVIATVAGILGDIFWFVPFVQGTERRLHEACELAADARAVRSVDPAVLASALVRAQEVMTLAARPRLATLAASETSLRIRLAQLLDGALPPRLGFQYGASRIALTFWVAATVFLVVAFGNH